MRRGLILTSIMFIAMVAFSDLTWAAKVSAPISGEYNVDSGKTKLVLKIVVEGKKLCDITVNLYDLSIASSYFSLSFVGDLDSGTFGLASSSSSGLLTLSGSWSRTGPTKFKVDSDLGELLDQLNPTLESMGLIAVKNEQKSYFTGNISPITQKITAKYNLAVDLVPIGSETELNITGTSLTLSGSLVASPGVGALSLAVSNQPLKSSVESPCPIKDYARSLAETIKEKIAGVR